MAICCGRVQHSLVQRLQRSCNRLSTQSIGLWNNFTTTISGIWNRIIKIASGIWGLIKAAVMGPILLLLDAMTGNWNQMKGEL